MSCVLTARLTSAQQTVGLFLHAAGSLDSGYVLFTPPGNTTYLIDKCGHAIHSWSGRYFSNIDSYLLPDGSILRPELAVKGDGTTTGIIEKIAWDGTVLWHYEGLNGVNRQHHDVFPMPNGNVLALVSDVHSAAEAFAAGADTSRYNVDVTSEQLIELQPIGADSAVVVWQWRAWDHLVQNVDESRDNYGSVMQPDLINFNYRPFDSSDWLHANSVMYNAAFDQIMISVRNFNEIWIVDHGTTTAEAASHAGGRHGIGGDVLYRWGNPLAYGMGTEDERIFFHQHSPRWIPEGLPNAGNVIVYNNGEGRIDGQYSTVDIFTPPCDSLGNYDRADLPYLPAALKWRYIADPPSSLYSNAFGSAQQLANGNVLICEGLSGVFTEIDTGKNIVWKYVCPVAMTGPITQGSAPINQSTFRCTFFPYSFAAFRGRRLPAGPPVERDPLPYDCTLDVDTAASAVASRDLLRLRDAELRVFPNPGASDVTVAGLQKADHVTVVNCLGQRVLAARSAAHLDTRAWPAGEYRVVALCNGRPVEAKFVIVK